MKAARRFTEHTPAIERVKRMDEFHPAVSEARTIYPARVVSALSERPLLKAGQHQRKIGSHVTKGRWAGMPIYTLTLEERATCPRDCGHWLTCYGNKMNWSRRIEPGPELERGLAREVSMLAGQHRRGFVVRLHVLGDFYSLRYVRLWIDLVRQFPALRVFGYTARDPLNDPIGVLLEKASFSMWGRFAIRFSGRLRSERSAVTLYESPTTPMVGGCVVCPAQTGRSDCCGTCGLCWQTTRNIAFLVH